MQSTESLRDYHLAKITDIQLTEIWCGDNNVCCGVIKERERWTQPMRTGEDITEEGEFGLVEFPWLRWDRIPGKARSAALAQKHDVAWYVCVVKAEGCERLHVTREYSPLSKDVGEWAENCTVQ